MEVRGQLWSSVLSFHWVGPGDLTHLLKLRGISLALCHLFFYVGDSNQGLMHDRQMLYNCVSFPAPHVVIVHLFIYINVTFICGGLWTLWNNLWSQFLPFHCVGPDHRQVVRHDGSALTAELASQPVMTLILIGPTFS